MSNDISSTDVGPKFGTHVPDRGAGEYLNLLILERLSRKLDASCTLVKLCWSLLRSAEAFSPGDRWGLLFKIRVYKWNNEQLIDASLFLFFVCGYVVVCTIYLDYKRAKMSNNISPVTVEPVVDWIPTNRVLRRFDSDLWRIVFFFVFKIRVYKWNNEQLIDASLFLVFVDPLLDWNPNSCGDNGRITVFL